jgi:hypothetical protein
VQPHEAGLEALRPAAAQRAGDERLEPAGQPRPFTGRADPAGAVGGGALAGGTGRGDQDGVEGGVAIVPRGARRGRGQCRTAGGDHRRQGPERRDRRLEPGRDAARAREHGERAGPVAAGRERLLCAAEPVVGGC